MARRSVTGRGYSAPMPAIRPPPNQTQLFRANLANGQTGLSIAFDLPTQTGYDSDHVLARGEVGKVGVPIGHIGDMRALFADIPVARMNTSMTINATAPWLMALYIALADEQGAPRATLQGTTQNDIIKEYLSRGSYVFAPSPSLRLTTDMILFGARETPKWNPMNVCSYHLQEAGATPVQEMSYALATAIAVLDLVKTSGQVDGEAFDKVVGGMSFFVNAGMRFVTELCKMRAFCELWDEITRDRYGVRRREAPSFPLRRAGQFARPHRTAARKQRLSHSHRDARRRAVEECAGARRAAARVERGARPAAPLRSAMVAAHPADHGLRDRPARIWRPVRRQPRNRAQGRLVEGRGTGRTRHHRRARRHRAGGRKRLPQIEARRIQHRPDRDDRERRTPRRRRQRFRSAASAPNAAAIASCGRPTSTSSAAPRP